MPRFSSKEKLRSGLLLVGAPGQGRHTTVATLFSVLFFQASNKENPSINFPVCTGNCFHPSFQPIQVQRTSRHSDKFEGEENHQAFRSFWTYEPEPDFRWQERDVGWMIHTSKHCLGWCYMLFHHLTSDLISSCFSPHDPPPFS